MRCKYCHNPDTWEMAGGELYTAEEVLQKALRYKNYWVNGGGITVSGGEALLQMDFMIELFELAHYRKQRRFTEAERIYRHVRFR